MLSRLADISFPQRIHILEHALDLIAAAPVFGSGYQTEFLAHIPNSTDVYNSAHNTILAIARDGGLAGLGLQLLVISIQQVQRYLVTTRRIIVEKYDRLLPGGLPKATHMYLSPGCHGNKL